MKKILFIFLLLSLQSENLIQAQQMSDKIEISLLTVSSGEKLYTIFGHTALRIRNSATGSDIVYNYGMFSFDSPNFYFDFINGRLNYWLGTESFNDFKASYILENREIQEQVFEMNSIQKQTVIHFLENNLKTENRYYPYLFFKDNCSTRIRDLILLTYKGIEFSTLNKEITYRELTHEHLNNMPWVKLGMDLVLGVSADKKTSVFEQMFLPKYLSGVLISKEYNQKQIIKETHTIFTSEQSVKLPPLFITPMFIFSCVLVLSILFCFNIKGAKIFDFILFLLVGIVGTILLSLWFFTDHIDMKTNYNIIWALPTHLFISFYILFNKHGNTYKWYFLATTIITLTLLLLWTVLPQKLNPALIPLVISVSLRALWNSLHDVTLNRFTKTFNFSN